MFFRYNSFVKVRDVIRLIEADGWYLIVIEKANGNYSAYCPDIPGCIATGKTKSETAENMQRALELHISGMRDDRLPIPKGQAEAEYIAVQ